MRFTGGVVITSITVSCQSGSNSFNPVNGKLRGPRLVISTNTEKSIKVKPIARPSARFIRSKILSVNSTAVVAFSPVKKEIYHILITKVNPGWIFF